MKPVPRIVARGTVVVESRVTRAVIAAPSNPVREKRISAAAAVTPARLSGTGDKDSTGFPAPKRPSTRAMTAMSGTSLMRTVTICSAPAERVPRRFTSSKAMMEPSATAISGGPEMTAGHTCPSASGDGDGNAGDAGHLRECIAPQGDEGRRLAERMIDVGERPARDKRRQPRQRKGKAHRPEAGDQERNDEVRAEWRERRRQQVDAGSDHRADDHRRAHPLAEHPRRGLRVDFRLRRVRRSSRRLSQVRPGCAT